MCQGDYHSNRNKTRSKIHSLTDGYRMRFMLGVICAATPNMVTIQKTSFNVSIKVYLYLSYIELILDNYLMS